MKSTIKTTQAVRAITVMLGILLLTGNVFSQELKNEKLTLHGEKKQNLVINDKILNPQNVTVPLKNRNLLGELNQEREFSSVYQNTQQKKKKSVGLGVLLSALLPGAGEFYGESYLKAAIFFGVEILAWGTYIYFEKKGDDKTEEYYAYADQYWDIRTYARWLKNEGFSNNSQINPEEPNRSILEEQIRECERVNFSHTLPEWKSQQYYELIGKYQNFQAGWTNLAHVPTKSQGPYWYETYHDPVFTNYAKEREKANDFYEYAKIGPVTAIINHVLSAADAAWVISTYNKKIKVETGFRMDNKVSPYTYRYVQVPTFNLSVGF